MANYTAGSRWVETMSIISNLIWILQEPSRDSLFDKLFWIYTFTHCRGVVAIVAQPNFKTRGEQIGSTGWTLATGGAWPRVFVSPVQTSTLWHVENTTQYFLNKLKLGILPKQKFKIMATSHIFPANRCVSTLCQPPEKEVVRHRWASGAAAIRVGCGVLGLLGLLGRRSIWENHFLNHCVFFYP